MTDESLQRASKIDTATLSDAMDRLGVSGQCLGIKPLDPKFRMVGRAFTLQYAPHAPGGTVGDFIDDVPQSDIVVIDNGGRPDATVWGDILTLVAHRRGLAGTVIDGACRDTHLARELGYPLYSRSYSMRTGKDRVQLESVNTVITVGDARVCPGDLVRGDADGVVVIPRLREAEVLAAAEQIEVAEACIREAVLQGVRLSEARQAQKYHSLQTRLK